MFLTNFVLSTLIGFSALPAFDYEASTYNAPTKIKEVSAIRMTADISLLCALQNIYTDIYPCTKTYLGKRTPDIYVIYAHEENSIANWFWTKNLWDLGAGLAYASIFSLSQALYFIDSSGISSLMFTTIFSIFESICISHWAGTFLIQNIDAKIPVFVYTF